MRLGAFSPTPGAPPYLYRITSHPLRPRPSHRASSGSTSAEIVAPLRARPGVSSVPTYRHTSIVAPSRPHLRRAAYALPLYPFDSDSSPLDPEATDMGIHRLYRKPPGAELAWENGHGAVSRLTPTRTRGSHLPSCPFPYAQECLRTPRVPSAPHPRPLILSPVVQVVQVVARIRTHMVRAITLSFYLSPVVRVEFASRRLRASYPSITILKSPPCGDWSGVIVSLRCV
ncbi:hypothetical protein B0H12DRAFT_1237405 [Mycena haematopus]|nr:hypothetical protein B0H12DRAFT_1237405 [Mycena haematopus]